MGFRAKIFTVLAIVGLVPTALLGWLSWSVNRAELERTVGSAQLSVATQAAAAAERFVAQSVESIRASVSVLPLSELKADELASVLRIPYRQLPFVNALALVGSDGAPLAPPVFESGNAKADTFGAADADRLLRAAPVRLAQDAGTAIGAPFAGSGATMRVPVALRLDERRVLVAELSLEPLRRQMRTLGAAAYVVDPNGVVLAGEGQPSADEQALMSHAPGFRVVDRHGEHFLAAAAPAGTLGWSVVVLQRAEDAFRPAEQVRRYTLFWAGVAVLLIAALGAILSRHVTEPVAKLVAAVRALGEGKRTAVEVTSHDEIGDLSAAFNRMAEDILRRDEEIRRWNAELQERVDQNTRDLKAAQDQIMRTRRLAALGAMGAGISHELNNPLTAISGLAAILKRDLAGTPHEPQLEIIQQQSRRVSRIVNDLRQFATRERIEAGRRFQLEQPVNAALELYKTQLEAKHIAVKSEVKPGLKDAQGDPLQIQQVVAHLVENAMNAMPQGGELRITVGDVDGDALKLTVSDTGKGIPRELRERIFDPFFTTKDEPSGVGLGLSVSHSIVEAHHGKLLVESAEGAGATFTVVLPAAAAAAHLI